MRLCWKLAVGLSAFTVVVAPLTLVPWFERGKSPAEVFACRGRSLPYVTVWTGIAIVAIVLAAFNGAADCFEVGGTVFAGFIPVCFWRVYFENYDFVEQFVKENRERMRYLLFVGMGVDENTFESISSTVETVLVEFLTKKLTKRWTEFSKNEIGELMFDTGIETAKVIADKLRDDAHWRVFAFMAEWQSCVERIRVPMRAIGELRKQSMARQFLHCIAIILANETLDIRKSYARLSAKVNLSYSPTAGATAWQAAVEGILDWPDCLQKKEVIRIRHVDFRPKDLHLAAENRRCSANDIPRCVLYTLREMIVAGFLHLPLNGKTAVTVSFKNAHAVFKRKDWDEQRTIDRRPFRYITSATRLDGDPAFVIEQRGLINGAVVRNGSRLLEGILNAEVEVEGREEMETWLQQADVRREEGGIWGELKNFVTPLPLCRIHCLMLTAISKSCDFLDRLKRSLERFRNKVLPP